MDISLTVGAWAVPVFVMVLIWAIAVFWPRQRHYSGGYGYGWGASFDAFVRLIIAGGSTLVVWLLYFMIMYWLAVS